MSYFSSQSNKQWPTEAYQQEGSSKKRSSRSKGTSSKQANESNIYSSSSNNNDDNNNSYSVSPYYGYNGSPYVDNTKKKSKEANTYNSNNNDNHNSYDMTPYNNIGVTPYSPYNPYNQWANQDPTRPPMFIRTNEVNMYNNPYGNNDQERRRGGFFGSTLGALGDFFDRKLGINKN